MRRPLRLARWLLRGTFHWSVVGSGATLLLLFFVKLILPWSTTRTRRLDVKYEPETITDAGIPASSDECSLSAAAEDRS